MKDCFIVLSHQYLYIQTNNYSNHKVDHIILDDYWNNNLYKNTCDTDTSITILSFEKQHF